MPLTNPVHDAPRPDTTQLPADGDTVTTYPVITAPPVDTGACHCTATDPSPGTAVTDRGALGTVRGVTDKLEAPSESPASFDATTVNT